MTTLLSLGLETKDQSTVAETTVRIKAEEKTYKQDKVGANGTKVGKHGKTKLFTSDCQHVLLLLFAKV